MSGLDGRMHHGGASRDDLGARTRGRQTVTREECVGSEIPCRSGTARRREALRQYDVLGRSTSPICAMIPGREGAAATTSRWSG